MNGDWLERAACKGTAPSLPWHWSEPPSPPSALACLRICESCPVRRECRQDAADTGERYPYQVRGGLRFWTDEVDLLPDPVVYFYQPPEPKPGRPRSPLPEYRTHSLPKYTDPNPRLNPDPEPGPARVFKRGRDAISNRPGAHFRRHPS